MVLRGVERPRSTFNAQMGLGHDEYDVHTHPVRSTCLQRNLAHWAFHTRWRDLMLGVAWAESAAGWMPSWPPRSGRSAFGMTAVP